MSTETFTEQGYAALPLFDRDLILAAREDIAEHIDRVSRALYLPFEQTAPDAADRAHRPDIRARA